MANSCPICAGLGAGTGNAAGDAAKKFDDLIAALGGANTAGSALQGVLDKLTTAEAATAAAAKLAAETGHKAADVRRAMAAQAKDAADAARALAAAEAAAAKERSAALKAAALEATRLAAEQAKAAQKAGAEGASVARDKVKAFEAERREQAKAAVDAFLDRNRRAEAAKEQARHAAEVRSEMGKLTATGNRTLEVWEALKAEYGLAAQGLALMAAGAVIAVGVLTTLAAKAIEASQAAMRVRESFGAFFGTGAAGGAKFAAGLDKIAAKLPYTGAEIRKWAQPLIEARLRGAQLQRAIEAVAAANAMMGESGASAAQGLIKQFAAGARLNQAVWLSPDMLDQLAAAGVSAEVLAKELGISEKRLQLSTVKASVMGDVLQRVLLRQGAGSLALVGQTWSSITAKVNEGITSAFAGLGDLVQPFMKELQYLASELFKGSAASEGMGAVLRAVLKPAFELATSAVRALHYGLLYVEIAALTVYIALRPLGQWLERVGVVSFMASWGLLALKWIAIGLAAILGVLGLAFFLMVIVPAGLVVAAITLIVFGLYKLGSAVVAAVGFLAGLAGAGLSAGKNLVMGLVQSIASGAGAVVDAVKGLASSAINSLLSTLQIRSPSRVAAWAGGHFVAGFTGAVDEGQVEAEDAGSGLGKSATRGLVRAGGEAGGKGSGRAIQFINCVFGQGLSETIVRDMIARILEAESASGPEPEPAT